MSRNGALVESARALLASGREFDYVMVETSGLANPYPVAQTFLAPELERSFRLDAVVTMVDAANIETWIEQNATAGDQIRYADLLVLNKLDLVMPEDVDRLKVRLSQLNAAARVLPAINADLPPELLLDVEVHRPKQDAERRYRPAHRDTVDSVSFGAALELDYDRFDRFLQELPDGVFRAKGTVAIQGLKRRVIFHRVGGRNVLDQGAPWGDEPRASKAVFLGQQLDRQGLLAKLEACCVARS